MSATNLTRLESLAALTATARLDDSAEALTGERLRDHATTQIFTLLRRYKCKNKLRKNNTHTGASTCLRESFSPRIRWRNGHNKTIPPLLLLVRERHMNMCPRPVRLTRLHNISKYSLLNSDAPKYSIQVLTKWQAPQISPGSRSRPH